MKKQLNSARFCLLFTLFSSSLNANLLVNSGFEAGLTDWQSSGNAAIRTSNPPAYEGNNYIFGSDTPEFSVWQDVDLIGQGFLPSEIDTGDLMLNFGGWQSGYLTQQDSGQISVRLLDETMAEIGNASLPSFSSNHTWVEQTGSTNILSGTRFVRYEFVGTRVDGSNNDAYLDAANVNVVPLPAAFWLFGSGLISLLGISKRHKVKALLSLRRLC